MNYVLIKKVKTKINKTQVVNQLAVIYWYGMAFLKLKGIATEQEVPQDHLT